MNQQPLVIMLNGVNGSGKTTSISKLAHHFLNQNRNVYIIGADTYRAAADAQLTQWCERLNVPYITAASMGIEKAHPAHVAGEGLKAFIKEDETSNPVFLLDTSGRLHVDAPLMQELAKVKRSVEKVLNDAYENAILLPLLVLDATTGQNALKQVKVFDETLKLSGLILSKFDASAKGGSVFSIARQYELKPLYVTTGENIEALHTFDDKVFVHSLLQYITSS